MAIVPAITITRDIMNQYAKAGITGKSKPEGIWIQPVVKDFIPIMSRLDTPMNDMVGEAKFTTDNNVLRYGEGDILPQVTTFAEAVDTTETVISVTNAAMFQQWSQFRSKQTGEVFLVTEDPVITSGVAGDLVVERDWPSHDGVGIAADTATEIQIMLPAVPENADAPRSPRALGNTAETYCQIIEKTWDNSHRSRVTPDAEVKSDRFKAERAMKAKESALELDYNLLYGVPNEGDGTGENPSTMGGVFHFTTAHANPLGGDPLELLDLLNGLQDVAEDVGTGEMGKTLMMGYRASAILASYFKSNRRYPGKGDIDITENGFITDFGHITKKLNWRMDVDQILLCNPADWKRGWFEGGAWSQGLYSTQGWYDRAFLRCDIGAMFVGERRRAKWTGFATDDASYPGLGLV